MLAGIGTVIYCITAERGMAYRMGSNPTTADLIAISIILCCFWKAPGASTA